VTAESLRSVTSATETYDAFDLALTIGCTDPYRHSDRPFEPLLTLPSVWRDQKNHLALAKASVLDKSEARQGGKSLPGNEPAF
jgi:hypothetical protein